MANEIRIGFGPGSGFASGKSTPEPKRADSDGTQKISDELQRLRLALQRMQTPQPAAPVKSAAPADAELSELRKTPTMRDAVAAKVLNLSVKTVRNYKADGILTAAQRKGHVMTDSVFEYLSREKNL